jgi:hypothetical protein
LARGLHAEAVTIDAPDIRDMRQHDSDEILDSAMAVS